MIYRRRQTDRRIITSSARGHDGAAVDNNKEEDDNKIDEKALARRRQRPWSSTFSGPGGVSNCRHRLRGTNKSATTDGTVSCCRRLALLWAGAPLACFLYSIQTLSRLPGAYHDISIMLWMFDPSNPFAASHPVFPSLSTLAPLDRGEGPDFDGIDVKRNSIQGVSLHEVRRVIRENDKKESAQYREDPHEFRRVIRQNDEEESAHYREEMLDLYDDYDEDSSYDHTQELEYSDCQRTRLHDMYYPNCNPFHEIDLHRMDDDHVPNFDVHMFSHGYFRDVWRIAPLDGSDPIVLKTTRWEHEFNHYYINNVRRDAAVMVVLASSPRIVNIYGACSTSVSVAPAVGQIQLEYLPRDPFDDNAQEPYIMMRDLHDEDDVNPLNNLTASQKIEYALAIAEPLADLHGYEGGVCIHDDMTPDQYLRTSEGNIILGDFNRALVLDWNVETNEYCKTDDGRGFGFYRAPEEKLDLPQDEKIDVWSVGCQFYGLLTGLRPYYWDSWHGFKKKVRKGIRPYIDKRYRTRSYAEGELIKIMERCWEFHPEKRADIFEIVRRLRYVRNEMHKHE